MKFSIHPETERVFDDFLADVDSPKWDLNKHEGRPAKYTAPELEGDPNDRDWCAKLSRPAPELGSGPDGKLYTAMYPLLINLRERCPTFCEVLKWPLNQMPWEKLGEIVDNLPDPKEERFRGVQGLYLLINGMRKIIQIGQSGDLQGRAYELLETELKLDYAFRVLLTYPTPVTLYTRALDKKILHQAFADHLPSPVLVTDVHQPMYDEKDDVEERKVFKEKDLVHAYALLHDAMWEAVWAGGPKVPRLRLHHQTPERLHLLYTTLSPCIARTRARAYTIEAIIEYLAVVFSKRNRARPWIIKRLQKDFPWDKRGRA